MRECVSQSTFSRLNLQTARDSSYSKRIYILLFGGCFAFLCVPCLACLALPWVTTRHGAVDPEHVWCVTRQLYIRQGNNIREWVISSSRTSAGIPLSHHHYTYTVQTPYRFDVFVFSIYTCIGSWHFLSLISYFWLLIRAMVDKVYNVHIMHCWTV